MAIEKKGIAAIAEGILARPYLDSAADAETAYQARQDRRGSGL